MTTGRSARAPTKRPPISVSSAIRATPPGVFLKMPAPVPTQTVDGDARVDRDRAHRHARRARDPGRPTSPRRRCSRRSRRRFPRRACPGDFGIDGDGHHRAVVGAHRPASWPWGRPATRSERGEQDGDQRRPACARNGDGHGDLLCLNDRTSGGFRDCSHSSAVLPESGTNGFRAGPNAEAQSHSRPPYPKDGATARRSPSDLMNSFSEFERRRARLTSAVRPRGP